MKGRKTAAEQLTSAENERVLATLTPRAWRKMVVLATRAKMYGPGGPPSADFHPLDYLLHEARQTSGAIGGEHRKDLVAVMRGEAEQARGAAVAKEVQEKPRRGL